MDRFYALTDRMSRIASWGGGGILLIAAAMIMAEVCLRKFFNISLGGSDEIAGYVLAISTTWGLSFALIGRANIRIDALYMRLPRRITAWLDLFALTLMGAFMAFVTWFAIKLWAGSFMLKVTAPTPLQTPLMIPQTLWVAGLILFQVVLLVCLGRVIRLLTRGDLEGVAQVAGIRAVEEEVRDEVSEAVLEQLKK